MGTTVYVNGNGLDFTAPYQMPQSRAENPTSGYARFNDYMVEWTGTKLRYNDGYFIPTSGILTSCKLRNASGELQFYILCKYKIKTTDASPWGGSIFGTIAALDNVQWKGGNNDDNFYYLGNNDSVDAGLGEDSITLSQNFSSYTFSNVNTGTSSVTVSRPDLKTSINLKSIENFIFKDQTISFSDIPLNPNNAHTGSAIIKGLATWGTTLSISNTIKDIDGLGTFSYLWQTESTDLSTSSTYKLTESDIDEKIWVTVSYTDKKGHLEEVSSNEISVTISTKASAVNDILTGTDAADKLSSLAGNDTLIGGLGADKLTGGKGADTFNVYGVDDSGITAETRDTITDFKHSEGDKIDFWGVEYDIFGYIDGTLLGRLTFIGGEKFSTTDATGQLRFDATAHILYGSTNADSAPEFSILLSGVKSLVPEDFIL
jgi:Ca2+-binding RTX toxin-like protein